MASHNHELDLAPHLPGHIAQGADCSGQGRGEPRGNHHWRHQNDHRLRRRPAYEALCVRIAPPTRRSGCYGRRDNRSAQYPEDRLRQLTQCLARKMQWETRRIEFLCSRRRADVHLLDHIADTSEEPVVLVGNRESRPGLLPLLGTPLNKTGTRISGCYTRSSPPLCGGGSIRHLSESGR